MPVTRTIAIQITKLFTSGVRLPFKILWQNNTYTVLMIKDINDETVHCNPGNLRAFITVVLEHRIDDQAKIAFVLVPPTLNNSNHRFNTLRDQAVLLTSTPSKYNNTFITLLSFSKERLHINNLQVGLDKIAKEIQYLQTYGTPSNPAYYNNISDWTKLFALLHTQTNTTVAPTPKAQLSNNVIIPHQTRFSRVLWLGAEFNSNQGDVRSMDEISHVALRNGLRSQDTYFQILKAQVNSLGISMTHDSLYFDDVSIVPSGGRHSDEDIYRKNVTLSKWYHIRLLHQYQPSLIIIGGGLAMREYVRQVLSDSVIQPIVLRLRNPSPQAHFGTIYGEDGWLEQYQQKEIGTLLAQTMTQYSNQKHFELIVNEDGWRIKPF